MAPTADEGDVSTQQPPSLYEDGSFSRVASGGVGETRRGGGDLASEVRFRQNPYKHSKPVFLECPMFEVEARDNPRVSETLSAVARHYDADRAILTWRAQGELHFKLDSSVERWEIPRRRGFQEYNLFNHTIPRELPTIIYDVTQHEVYKHCILPSFVDTVRFYAAAPLIFEKETYVGTLCIVDSSRSRGGFLLDDAAYLVQKASELVDIMGRAACLSEASNGTGGAHDGGG